jgi:hypothetical protein
MKATIIILVLRIICLILGVCFLLKMQKDCLKTTDSLYYELTEATRRQLCHPAIPDAIERKRVDLEPLKFSHRFRPPLTRVNNSILECEFINAMFRQFEKIIPWLIKRRDGFDEVEMEMVIYVDRKDLDKEKE